MTKTSSSQIVQLQRQWWIPGKPSRCCCSFYEPWLDKGNIRLAVPPKYSKPTPFFYNTGVVKNSHPFSTVHNNHRWITFFPPHISKSFLSFLAAFQEMLPPRSFEVLEWWCSQALFITWKGGTANVTSLSGIMEGCVQSSLSENLNRKVRKVTVTALRPGVFGCQDPWFPLVYHDQFSWAKRLENDDHGSRWIKHRAMIGLGVHHGPSHSHPFSPNLRLVVDLCRLSCPLREQMTTTELATYLSATCLHGNGPNGLQDEAKKRSPETPKKPVADLNRLEVFSVSDFCFVGLCLTAFFNFFCGFNRFGFVLYGLFGLQLTLGFISWTCWRPPAIRTASHCWVFLSHTRLVHQQYPAFFFSRYRG